MKENSLKYTDFEILEALEIAPETVQLKLKGKFIFEPGQFLQASLSNYGEGTFAPCNNPKEKTNFEVCVKSFGNLSRQMIQLLPGDYLKVRGPYGNGWPIGKIIGKNILIIAGGMGLVPLRPLIYEILENREDFKQVKFLAGFKSPHHILFTDDLENWQKKLNYFNLCLEYGQCELNHEKGFVMSALKDIEIDKNTIVLMCGPEIMYHYCLPLLKNHKIPEENIYLSYERRMECGIGACQHCNIGKYLVCENGPVFRYDIIKDEIGK